MMTANIGILMMEQNIVLVKLVTHKLLNVNIP